MEDGLIEHGGWGGVRVGRDAVREVLEETGLTVEAERLTGTYYMAENDSLHFVFLCSMTHDGQDAISASEETTDCGYFPPDGLPRPISDFTVRRIQDALRELTLPLPLKGLCTGEDSTLLRRT